MAYYTNFINGWNSVTQPPTGVTGTALTGGMTTAQKLANVNAWTVTGAVPTTIYVTGDEVKNCVDWTEFAALTADKQTNLLNLLGGSQSLLGGSSHLSSLMVGMLINYFNVQGTTIANLTALSRTTTQPWWQFSGYARPFDMGDVAAAGLT